MTVRARSIRVLLLCLTPIMLWAIAFFLIYGAQTLACISPVAGRESAIGVRSMIAFSAIAAGAVFFAARRLRLKDHRDGAQSFLAKTSIELAGLAALATIWIVLATATVPLCAVRS